MWRQVQWNIKKIDRNKNVQFNSLFIMLYDGDNQE